MIMLLGRLSLSLGLLSLSTLFLAVPPGVNAIAYPKALPLPLYPNKHTLFEPRDIHKLLKRLQPLSYGSHSSVSSAEHGSGNDLNEHKTVSGGTKKNSTSTGHHHVERVSDQPYEQIQGLHDQFAQNSVQIKRLAAKSAAAAAASAAYQNDAIGLVSGFHGLVQALRAPLSSLAADTGNANYVNTDQMQTLLKDIVNYQKDTVTQLDLMMYNVPVLGSTLGPMVYDVKCMLDDVMDATENMTDGLLNALGLTNAFNSLLSTLQVTGDESCTGGMKILGVCL